MRDTSHSPAIDLRDLLREFRAALAKRPNGYLYATVVERIGDTKTYLKDDAEAHTLYYAGTVGAGAKVDRRTLFFTVMSSRGNDSMDEFVNLARKGGAMLLSPSAASRIGVYSTDGPEPLWLAFLLKFGSPEERNGYRRLPDLFCQSVIALERWEQERLTKVEPAAVKADDLLRRSEVARRLNVHPGTVTQLVRHFPDLAESPKPRSRVFLNKVRAKLEERRARAGRDAEIADRARRDLNRHAWGPD